MDQVRRAPESWGRLLRPILADTGWFSAAAIFILLLHVVLDVVMRYAFNAPFRTTMEVVSFWWMPAVVFLALALTQQRGEHISVTLFLDYMPNNHRRLAMSLTQVASLVLIVFVGWAGMRGALLNMTRGEVAMGLVAVPVWPARFLLPIGMALLAVQMLLDIFSASHKDAAS